MRREVEEIGEAALDARDANQTVFACTALAKNLSEVITAVESVGWKLDHFSTSLSPSFAKTLLATCIFRPSSHRGLPR
jgi:hypothetical protein